MTHLSRLALQGAFLPEKSWAILWITPWVWVIYVFWYSFEFPFDEAYVTGELEFYGVGAKDRVSVIKALRKIGKITWPGDDTHGPMVFQIPPDGKVVRIGW